MFSEQLAKALAKDRAYSSRSTANADEPWLIVPESQSDGVPTDSPDAELDPIVRHAQLVTHADGAALALLGGGAIVCRASCGYAPAAGVVLDPTSGVCGRCFATGKVVLWSTADADASANLSSVLAVPICVATATVGLLATFSTFPEAFTSHHVTIITRIAQAVACQVAAAGAVETPITGPGTPTGTSVNTAIASLSETEQSPLAAANRSMPLPVKGALAAQQSGTAAGPGSAAALKAREISSAPVTAPEPVPRAPRPEVAPPIGDSPAQPPRPATALRIVPTTASPTASVTGHKTHTGSLPGVTTARAWHFKPIAIAASILVVVLIGAYATIHWGTPRASLNANRSTAPLTADIPAAKPAAPTPVEPAPASTEAPGGPAVSKGSNVARGAETLPQTRKPAAPRPMPIVIASAQRRPDVAETESPPPLVPVQAANTLPLLGRPVAEPKFSGARSAEASEPLIVPPKLVRQTPIVLPPYARVFHQTAVVILAVTVRPNGTVASARPLRGDAILAKAVADSVSQWRYQPATSNGKPVEGETELTIRIAPRQ